MLFCCRERPFRLSYQAPTRLTIIEKATKTAPLLVVRQRDKALFMLSILSHALLLNRVIKLALYIRWGKYRTLQQWR